VRIKGEVAKGVSEVEQRERNKGVSVDGSVGGRGMGRP
jgi:hypothetical protein